MVVLLVQPFKYMVKIKRSELLASFVYTRFPIVLRKPGWENSPLEDVPLKVNFPEPLSIPFTEEQQKVLIGILERDPRPHYHFDEQRVYGMEFGGYDIRFRGAGDTAIVYDILKSEE